MYSFLRQYTISILVISVTLLYSLNLFITTISFLYFFHFFPTILFAERRQLDRNCSAIFSFVDLFYLLEFKRKLNSLEVPIKVFVRWVDRAAILAAKDIMNKMEETVLNR